MQSYGDFLPIPRKNADSSLTCMDKHPIFGQIGEKFPKFVHKNEYFSNFFVF